MLRVRVICNTTPERRAEILDSDKVAHALKKIDLLGVPGRIRFDPKSNPVILSLAPV
jgi:branched-chain amino acid transport system substrate-binding protein